jgi:hypothetical protein
MTPLTSIHWPQEAQYWSWTVRWILSEIEPSFSQWWFLVSPCFTLVLLGRLAYLPGGPPD